MSNVVVQLDNNYFVTAQIMASDMAEFKAQGFEQIINNRPEGESEGQPSEESIRLAAEALGMQYVNNPIVLSQLSQQQIDTQEEALLVDKKTLAFCRTGTRSSVLWVLSETGKGGDYSQLVTEVSGKGFDLERCAPAMAPFVKG
ncbi:TIGR01244 family sulfur transferase [Marinomonas sp. C2222]|uniref:TIGR01244 family sulfur transferase n=1 Tax=Marinomonas sargassi TaxID=2984494 RepID=A0ABT2YT57_9GAMM|nr:TIGR01244 family sulfur transferase [Marinomonas sargassi]MCV2403071.1 TIGR01244 family sulfur transferase [Marinomonas sargassi]